MYWKLWGLCVAPGHFVSGHITQATVSLGQSSYFIIMLKSGLLWCAGTKWKLRYRYYKNKKKLLWIKTSNELQFFMSKGNAYYLFYKNPPSVEGFITPLFFRITLVGNWACFRLNRPLNIHMVIRNTFKLTVSDMEFVINFTQTHVFVKSFTPKYSVNYAFICQEDNIF